MSWDTQLLSWAWLLRIGYSGWATLSRLGHYTQLLYTGVGYSTGWKELPGWLLGDIDSVNGFWDIASML